MSRAIGRGSRGSESERSITGIYTPRGRLAFWIESLVDDMFLYEAEILVKSSGSLAWPMWTGYHRKPDGWQWQVLVEGHRGDTLLNIGKMLLDQAGPETATGTAWEVRGIYRHNAAPEFVLELVSGLPQRALRAVDWERLGDQNPRGDAPIAFPRLARG